MARPAKPIDALIREGRKNLTRGEITARRAGEAAMQTGVKMRPGAEIMKDADAARHYDSTRAFLSELGRDDALYERGLYRYSLQCAQYSRIIRAMQTAAPATDGYNRLFTAAAILSDALMAYEAKNGLTMRAGLHAARQSKAAPAADTMESLLMNPPPGRT